MPCVATGKISHHVAKKIIANYVKGNPHFKPDHGEHGGCSWFLHSGNPHTGVGDNKTIEVSVSMDEMYVEVDDKLLNTIVDLVKQKYGALLQDNRKKFDLIVWDSVGVACSKRSKATLLKVDNKLVSAQGSGYFLVVPQSSAEHLLVDFKSLQEKLDTSDIKHFASYVDAATKRAEEKNKLSPAINLRIGDYESDESCYNDLKSIANEFQALKKRDEVLVSGDEIRSMGPGGWSDMRITKTKRLEVRLEYHCFREARNAFKRILAFIHLNNMRKVKVLPGEGWSPKQGSLFGGMNKPRITS